MYVKCYFLKCFRHICFPFRQIICLLYGIRELSQVNQPLLVPYSQKSVSTSLSLTFMVSFENLASQFRFLLASLDEREPWVGNKFLGGFINNYNYIVNPKSHTRTRTIIYQFCKLPLGSSVRHVHVTYRLNAKYIQFQVWNNRIKITNQLKSIEVL